jgi:hypothetical protein
MVDPALVMLYRRTSFVVRAPKGRFVLSIGARSRALDDLLTEYEVSSCAFITAWNPGSKRLSDDHNRERHEHLLKEIQNLGHLFLEGYGVSEDEAWPPETSLLIVGITQETAEELGQRFDQNAIVFAKRGDPVELLLLGNGSSNSSEPRKGRTS